MSARACRDAEWLSGDSRWVLMPQLRGSLCAATASRSSSSFFPISRLPRISGGRWRYTRGKQTISTSSVAPPIADQPLSDARQFAPCAECGPSIAPDDSFFSFRWPGNYPVTAASWRGETACGGAADGECGRQQRAESLHSYRPMSTRAAATSRAAWSRVVARTSRAERSAAQGSAERGATSRWWAP